jgi:hypothetical protein
MVRYALAFRRAPAKAHSSGITDVLVLMDGFYNDVRSGNEENLGLLILRLRRYLISVLGE